MSKSVLKDKSYKFAIRVVKLGQWLQKYHREYVISTQVVKSGTAVSALIREGEYAQSLADFVNKMSQSLKECNETLFWIDLMHDTDYISSVQHQSMITDCGELKAMLTASVKTAKKSVSFHQNFKK